MYTTVTKRYVCKLIQKSNQFLKLKNVGSFILKNEVVIQFLRLFVKLYYHNIHISNDKNFMRSPSVVRTFVEISYIKEVIYFIYASYQTL